MFFSTSPLPFCRQLINNKQLGDIEVAIRSIKGNVDKAKGLAKTAYDQGFLDGKEIGKPGVEMILSSSPEAQAKRAKTKVKRAFEKVGNDQKQKLNKPTSQKQRLNRTTPNQLAKGGGKIYASMDKKYGGGIYPRKPTNG